MSEGDINDLEDKNNNSFNQLISSITSITQAPPDTQVEDVKTIQFQNEINNVQQKNSPGWKQKVAKKQHQEERISAQMNIIKQRKFAKQQRKWQRHVERKKEATIVPDSGASSTCIRTADAEHVEILDKDSPKTFLNANGSESRAGKKARLPYNM